MKHFIKITFGLLLITLLAACKPAAASTSGLEDSTWKLETYTDAQGQTTSALPEVEATLEFSADKVSGSTGCNSFFADYTMNGDKLTFGSVGSTMMACEEPRMSQETAYLSALAKVASYRLTGGKLELLDASGATLLTFSELKPLPLVGTNWVMTAVPNGKDVVSSPVEGIEVTAVFGADGQVSGNAGCNGYSGEYKVDGEKLTIGPLISTKMACIDQAANDQEVAFLQAMEKAATYKLSHNSLEIRDLNGSVLVTFAVKSPR